MYRALSLSLLLLAACTPAGGGGAPAPPAPQTVRVEGSGDDVSFSSPQARTQATTLAIPLAQAWTALPQAYTELGLVEVAAHAGERRLTYGPKEITRSLKGTRLAQYLDCGETNFTPNANSYGVLLTVSTQLVGTSASETQVKTITEARARALDTRRNPVACTSKGVLERRIAEELQRLVG